MSDADIVREALGLSRSIVLCNEPWTHTAQTAWENGLEALDGLVARLAEAERRVDEERKRADGELRTAIAHERRLAEVERDRNLFRDVLALANERLAETDARWQEMEHPFDASEFKAMADRVTLLEEALHDLYRLAVRQHSDWMHFHELAMSAPFKAEDAALGFVREVIERIGGGEEQRT